MFLTPHMRRIADQMQHIHEAAATTPFSRTTRPQNWQNWQSCTGHIWRRNPPPVYKGGERVTLLLILAFPLMVLIEIVKRSN